MVTLDVKPDTDISKNFFENIISYPEGKNFRSCIQCGTCSGICPYGEWLDFTPRKIIHALRMGEFDQVLDSDRVWMCVSCYACASACPQQIPLTNVLMTKLKEELVISQNIPPELQEALENSQRYGNPMGESPRKRGEWTRDLTPEITLMGKEKRPVDILWFVGDYASYHPVVKKSTQMLAKILEELGIDFGILGPEEVSDGDSQRLAGEYGLYELLAEKNSRALEKYQFKKILTTDPHALNAFLNEYPKLGIVYPVVHYTQFLFEYLDEIRPMLKNEVKATVAFHDPCYLGRVNGIFEEPRELLKNIPGVHLVEMSHNRANSLCCGGGGGGMWLDGYQWEIAKTRTSEWRIQEMVAAKPIAEFVSVLEEEKKSQRRKNGKDEFPSQQILAVACPYEKPRFQDATKVIDHAKDLKIMDISEILAQSMGIKLE